MLPFDCFWGNYRCCVKVVRGIEGLHNSYRVHVGGIQDNIGSVLIMTSIPISSSFRGRNE